MADAASSTPTEILLPPVPGLVRKCLMVVSLVLILSAGLTAAWGALLGQIAPGTAPAWMLAGFELLVILAGVFGMLLARGRFRDGPAMALACIAGTILMSSVLGYMSTQGRLGTVSLKPWLLGRLLAAALIAAGAAWTVLSRNRASIPLFIKGAVLGAPVLAVLGYVGKSKGEVIASALRGGSLVNLALVGVGSVVVGVLFCISAHLLIRAFELGRPGERP